MGHDYLIHNLRNQYIDGNSVFGREMRKEAADLITDLLARAETAEARVRELEKLLSAVQNMENFHPDETGFFVFTKKDADDITGKLLAAEARAEKAERERDAAIKRLRETCWCAGCEHFKGLDGCQLGNGKGCSPENDRYKFAEKEE